jgi:hypothetical protein
MQGKSVEYSNVNNAYILKEQELSPLTSQVVSTQISFLAIEKSDGTVVRFSEEYYPIREILGQMKVIIEKK